MSNIYRVERDRDVVCVVDCGRLMASPLGDLTRLDAAVDAAVSVAAVADAVGDRAGTLAFDHEIRRSLSPRRAGGAAVVQALFDLEPRPVDSDYELAFRTSARRSAPSCSCSPTCSTSPPRARLPRRCRCSRAGTRSRSRARPTSTSSSCSPTSRSGSRRSTALPPPPRCSRRGQRVVARLRRAGALVIEAPAARPSRRLRQRLSQSEGRARI